MHPEEEKGWKVTIASERSFLLPREKIIYKLCNLETGEKSVMKLSVFVESVFPGSATFNNQEYDDMFDEKSGNRE